MLNACSPAAPADTAADEAALKAATLMWIEAYLYYRDTYNSDPPLPQAGGEAEKK